MGSDESFDARNGNGHIAFNNREKPSCNVLVANVHAGFRAEREGHHVGKDDFFHAFVARNQRRLHRCAACDGFVGIDRNKRDTAEQLGNGMPNHRHPRRAADQDDAVDLRRVQLGIAQCALQRLAQAAH